MAGRPLRALKVHPALPIGSDCTHLITPIEPVRIDSTGGPAAVRTRLGWTPQGPTQDIKASLSASQCLFIPTSSTINLFSNVAKLWQMDVLPYCKEKLVVRSHPDQKAIKLLEEQTVRVKVDSTCRPALQEHGVVYNFSVQFKGHNPNELLLPGPTVGPSLLAVLLRFWHSAATSGECFIRAHYFCGSSGEIKSKTVHRKCNKWQVLPFRTTCRRHLIHPLEKQIMYQFESSLSITTA